jgi:hypothetical protein
LTGALNVEVNGAFFNVSFVEGSCVDLFSGCTEPSDFDFTTATDAAAAGQALLDEVFLDLSQGTFDTDPTLTDGCEANSGDRCIVHIPYVLNPASAVVALTGFANNGVSSDSSGNGGIPITLDFGTRPDNTFARFTLVPIPATLPLMGTGLAVLGFMGWRRRRAMQLKAA